MQWKYDNKKTEERAEHQNVENIPAYFIHEVQKEVINLITEVTNLIDKPFDEIQNGMILFPFRPLGTVGLLFGLYTFFFLTLGVCAVGKLFFFCQNLVERLALLLPSAGEAVRRQDGTYINNRPQRDVVYL